MVNSKTSKIILVLVILLSLVLLLINTDVSATTPPNVTNSNVTVIKDPNETTNSNVTAGSNKTNSNTTQTNKTNTSSYGNNKLPQTGSSDYVIIGFVVICIISAIYAYKKIKDYKM